VLLWIFWPITTYIAVIAVYMLLLAVGAWLYRPSNKPGTNRGIAVIIPAHNEGERMMRTLQDLKNVNYPTDRLKVFVVADNCTDNTASVARTAGATVYERHDTSQRGKGPALDWMLRTQKSVLAPFDVVAFIDADMFVDCDFAVAIDKAFTDEIVVAVQSRNTVANPEDSWLSAFAFMSIAFANHVRTAGRSFWGGSCSLKGSGMAFRSSLILETGWPARSLAEDLEFAKLLTLRGQRVHYQPQAIVTSNIASGIRQVAVQQERWEGGKHEAVAMFLPKMLRAFLRRPSILLLDELLDLIIPPLTLLGLLLAGSALLAWLTGWIPLWLVFTCIGSVATGVITGLVQLRAPLKTLAYIAFAPAFVVMKLLLFMRLAVKRSKTSWTRTPRDGEAP
jgi:1,2-diacylglycerol 3-beta-glucosyltransferase